MAAPIDKRFGTHGKQLLIARYKELSMIQDNLLSSLQTMQTQDRIANIDQQLEDISVMLGFTPSLENEELNA